MQWRRAPYAWHHQERDGRGHADPEHDGVEVVVMVGRNQVRTVIGEVLTPVHVEPEPAVEHAADGRSEDPVEQRELGLRAADTERGGQRERARHSGIYSTLPGSVLPADGARQTVAGDRGVVLLHGRGELMAVVVARDEVQVL